MCINSFSLNPLVLLILLQLFQELWMQIFILIPGDKRNRLRLACCWEARQLSYFGESWKIILWKCTNPWLNQMKQLLKHKWRTCFLYSFFLWWCISIYTADIDRVSIFEYSTLTSAGALPSISVLRRKVFCVWKMILYNMKEWRQWLKHTRGKCFQF